MLKKVGKYIVRLSKEERDFLLALISKGKSGAKRIHHARILLRADAGEGGENLKDSEIVRLERSSLKTVSRIRQLFVEQGLEPAINRKVHSRTRPRKLNGEEEAQLIAICCSEAPSGRTRWTMKLLAHQLIELEIVDKISPETVRQTLKKMNLSLG